MPRADHIDHTVYCVCVFVPCVMCCFVSRSVKPEVVGARGRCMSMVAGLPSVVSPPPTPTPTPTYLHDFLLCTSTKSPPQQATRPSTQSSGSDRTGAYPSTAAASPEAKATTFSLYLSLYEHTVTLRFIFACSPVSFHVLCRSSCVLAGAHCDQHSRRATRELPPCE